MKKLIFVCILIMPFFAIGQKSLNFSVSREYWQHTDLWGIQAGLEYNIPINKIHLSVGLAFGYGEENRLQQFPGKQILSTLKVGFSPGYVFEYGFERVKTDDAKQLRINIGTSFNATFSKNRKLNFKTSIFGQKVNHFYVIDKLEDGFYVDYFGVFTGPLDVYIVSNQSFFTVGIEQKVGYLIKLKKDKVIMPFLLGAYGYNQTSYFGIGLSAGGVL